MSQHAESTRFSWGPASGLRETARQATGYWWLWLVAGIAWLAISLVILQFDSASITTVGVLIGVMFALIAMENMVVAAVSKSMRVPSVIFAVLFWVAAVLCFLEPKSTFAGVADMLGFLFLVVGIWWMVRSFMERPVNPAWWLGLISGILMTVLAFWTSGQFFIEKAYVLLVFAGIWALMQGIDDVVRAFAVRRLHEEI